MFTPHRSETQRNLIFNSMYIPSENIVGIDLGTTNSAIAIVQNGAPGLIEIDGAPTMPSCVGLSESGEVLVGKAALNQLSALPEQTIASIKRLMGTEHTVSMGEKQYRPEEISAFILKRLKEEAERQLDGAVSKAVITVPAYFDENQRRATQHAAELAGLEAIRILNEPTAAAMAYNLQNEEDQTILVYDLGGGTFDVSIVTCEKGLVEVQSSHGDTHLGGDDFDDALSRMLAEKWPNKSPLDLADMKTSRRLKLAAEAAKCRLSDYAFAEIREDHLQGEEHLESEIARHEFEELISPFLEKTWEALQISLQDAQLLAGNVDKILLVGGSTRIPIIQELIEAKIGRAPSRDVHPDLVVAMGAAIQGAIIAGEEIGTILVDIATHTFSTDAVADHYSPAICVPIIKRGTPLPVTRSEAFFTIRDNQEDVNITIYQGEASIPEENLKIGEFTVEGLSKAPSGNVILCELSLDLNGLLDVTATEKVTGLAKSVRIDTRNVKTTFDLAEARQKLAETFGDEDIINVTNTDEPQESSGGENKELARAKSLRKRAEKLIESGIDPDDESDLKQLLEQSRDAVKTREYGQLAEHSDQIEDIVFYLEE